MITLFEFAPDLDDVSAQNVSRLFDHLQLRLHLSYLSHYRIPLVTIRFRQLITSLRYSSLVHLSATQQHRSSNKDGDNDYDYDYDGDDVLMIMPMMTTKTITMVMMMIVTVDDDSDDDDDD